MGIKWRAQRKQAQDNFSRLIIGMHLYRTLSLKYGDQPHEISDGFYFNDIFLADLEKYIRLHESDDLSELMERFHPVILGNNKRLETWIDQTLASIDEEANKVILYLETITNLKLNFPAFKIATETWLKILALQPELRSRTSHFSLYNVAVVYAATRKLSNTEWSFRPSYCRKIELQNPSVFKQQVVALFRELCFSQGEQNPDVILALKCLDNTYVVSVLSDIAHQVILDAHKAQRAIRNNASVVPAISVKIPLEERVSPENIKEQTSKIDKASHNFVTKKEIRRTIVRIEREQLRRLSEEKRRLTKEYNGMSKDFRDYTPETYQKMSKIINEIEDLNRQIERIYPSPKRRTDANSVIAPIRIIKEPSLSCDEKCPDNYTENPDSREWLYLYDKSYRLDDCGEPDDMDDPEYIADQYLKIDYDEWMDEQKEQRAQQEMWENGSDDAW